MTVFSLNLVKNLILCINYVYLPSLLIKNPLYHLQHLSMIVKVSDQINYQKEALE